MDQAVYLSYRTANFVPVLVLVVDYVLMHLNHVNQLAVEVESFLALQAVELGLVVLLLEDEQLRLAQPQQHHLTCCNDRDTNFIAHFRD